MNLIELKRSLLIFEGAVNYGPVVWQLALASFNWQAVVRTHSQFRAINSSIEALLASQTDVIECNAIGERTGDTHTKQESQENALLHCERHFKATKIDRLNQIASATQSDSIRLNQLFKILLDHHQSSHTARRHNTVTDHTYILNTETEHFRSANATAFRLRRFAFDSHTSFPIRTHARID